MKGDLFLSRCSVNAVLAILRVIFVAKPIFQQDGTSAALQWNLDQGIRLSSKSMASEQHSERCSQFYNTAKPSSMKKGFLYGLTASKRNPIFRNVF